MDKQPSSTAPKDGVEQTKAPSDTRPDVTAHYLAAIVDSSHDAILSKDLGSIIRSWNRAAEQLFGYTAAEAIGRSITMLIPVDRLDEEAVIIDRIRKGEHISFETVRIRKDGSTVPVSLTISPVRSTEGEIIGASKIARDISERQQAQERQQFLMRELQHRTQNLFTVIQSVAKSSLRGDLSLAEGARVLDGRLQALAKTHRLLADGAWEGAQLSQIMQRELAPFSNHVRMSGEDICVHTLAAQQFALTVHELATNSAKYGAFSAPSGIVAIEFKIERESKPATFQFRWKESGGPPVVKPARRGLGSVILTDGAKQFAEEVALDYEPDGLSYAVRFPLSAIVAEKPGARQREFQSPVKGLT